MTTINIDDPLEAFDAIFAIYQNDKTAPEVKTWISELARQNPGVVPPERQAAVAQLQKQLVEDSLVEWVEDPTKIPDLSTFRNDVIQVIKPRIEKALASQGGGE